MSTTQQQITETVPETTTQSTKTLVSTEPECKEPETVQPSPDTEFDSEALFSSENISKLMDSVGETVKAVVLNTDGTMVEIDYNSTPKLCQINSILNASPSIIGQWEELGVILVKGRDSSSKTETNTHKLRFPFNNSETHKGPIFLYRVDETGSKCQDFTLAEYKVFVSKSSEDVGKVWVEPTEDELVQEEILEDESVTVEGVESQVTAMIERQFRAKYGRDPTEEETSLFSESIMSSFFGQFGGLDEDETVDPTYEPTIEEEEEELVEEEEAEEESRETEKFEREFDEALAHIKGLAISDSKTMFKKAKESYFKETGEECDEETLVEGFKLLKTKIFEETETTETVEVPETETITNVIVEEEETVEMPLSEEELRSEIAEAFDIVRQCGRIDGQQLAEMVSNTFYEINGREANLNEMTGVFSRLKDRLLTETKEDILETDESELDTIIDNLPESSDKTVKLNKSKQEELLKYASSIVTQEMANEAKVKFTETVGREPTLEEFNSLLITLATTRFLEADYSCTEEEDSDYNPNEETELEQELNDIKEDSLEVETESEKVVSVKKPIAFFSPLRNSKKTKSSYSKVPSSFVARGVKHFVAINNRQPTEEEISHLKSFFSIGNLEIQEPVVTETEEKINLMNSLEEYNSEDDSEYVPENDETCDVNEDYESVEDEQVKLELKQDLMLEEDKENEMTLIN